MALIPEFLPDIPSTLLSRAEWDRESTKGLAFFDRRRFGSLRKDSNKLESMDVAARLDQHELNHEALAQGYNEARAEYMLQHREFERGDQSPARLDELRTSLTAASAIYGQMITERQQVAETIETWADDHGYVRRSDTGVVREDFSRRNRNGEITALVNRVRGPGDADQLAAGTRWFQEGLAAIDAHQATLSESQAQDRRSQFASEVDAPEETAARQDLSASQRQRSNLRGRLQGTLASLSNLSLPNLGLRRARSRPQLPEDFRSQEAPPLPPGAGALGGHPGDERARVGETEEHSAGRTSRASVRSELSYADEPTVSRPRETLGSEPPGERSGARESVLSGLGDEAPDLKRFSDVRDADRNRPLSIGGVLESTMPSTGLSLEQAAAMIDTGNAVDRPQSRRSSMSSEDSVNAPATRPGERPLSIGGALEEAIPPSGVSLGQAGAMIDTRDALARTPSQTEQPQHRGRQPRDTLLPDRSSKSRSRSRS